MKKFLENAKNWLVFGLFASFVMIVSLFVYSKARQTANPWLTEGAPTGGLYVGANETLSAAKRNVLVKRWTREDVATTDTNDFDVECERRYKWHPTTGGDRWFYAMKIGTDPNRLDNYNNDNYRGINKGSKWTINSTDWFGRTTLKLQKKCQ